ncbi:F0F1 ATP synthase subunit epsilon [Demequina sp. TTPB684]|uniref:F0F1 ATP synthase subunit epsilon n=1 Tax=unclassified Demequina TaxID=2620311 RepID=UPI001CF29745|nr:MULTISPECIES: F0F1 ATP synthase subunit epsilon [unclassified Demequina]MCB2411764.1 F0F1 ATP synthase subunit epsilon [Demequina sp. TTPB684]UPU88646.1 F0F1 ATP synthase subunit epsilon [Demequina sp. TMPB413]
MALIVDIVAPDRVLWKGEATFVSAPAVEGSIGLLPGHEPILSVLGRGVVKVVQAGGEDRLVDIGGGFLSFDHDTITIVAEPAEQS